MTATELRDLLERVEAHGGPLRTDDGDVFCCGTFYTRISEHRPMSSIVGDHLVGVLKRDLCSKDVEWEVAFYPGDPENDYNMLITIGNAMYSASGMSELEATLNAWLIAAADEGWTP